tara:strand:+ start:3125 stop:3478 length:354 start_codon:yes stop_codon:yes gene_type:complete
MKKSQLRQIIKEELQHIISESMSVEDASQLGMMLAYADDLNYGSGGKPEGFEDNPFPYLAARVAKTGKYKQTLKAAMTAHDKAVSLGMIDIDGALPVSPPKNIGPDAWQAFENEFNT